MPKYKLICDNSYDLDTHVTTHEFSAETLDEVLENMKYFLMGAGFTWLDGELQFVNDDPIIGHSNHYFDEDRNK